MTTEKAPEVARAEQEVYRLALLGHAERQTELLTQINLLLWGFATVGLIAVVVLLLVASGTL